MQRIKSIDIFRGLCMTWMILAHLFEWWLKPEYSWLRMLLSMILDPIGVSGFLFISGVSIAISYKKRIIKVNTREDYNRRILRVSYLLRAFFIFIIAILYNISIAITLNDPKWIWTWFVLLTAAISLFIAWPLLKTSRVFRIFIGLMILIINQFIELLLIPYQGELNIYGLLFHIFYHSIQQDPIFTFFPFFLFGTVVGDTLFDAYILNQNGKNLRKSFIHKYYIPFLTYGIILVVIGIIFNFPNFIIRRSFSWIFYSLGIDIIIFSILLFFEVFEIVKPIKSYRFLFYYSFYSLTIYLGHNLLYFLFFHQLNNVNIWFYVLGAFILMGIMMRAIYKRWEGKASIKVLVGKLSLRFALKIEKSIAKEK